MKKKLLGFVSLMLFGATAATAADWFFDPVEGTMTDGVWTFTNVTATATDLTVGPCGNWPTVVSELDFAKPVLDASNTVYAIVGLDTKFAYADDKYDRCTITSVKSRSAGGEYVGSLKLPETNLTSIAQCAFGWCTSLTNVVPFLPDSVTSVSPAAFYNSPIAGDLFLRGVVGMQTDTIFLGTKITSMTFGPDLEELKSRGHKYQMLNGVTTLTNIVFDAACSNVSIASCVFDCSITLADPLVLNGVVSLADRTFRGVNVETVVFPVIDGIQNIGNDRTFENNASLTNVCFRGKPPASLDLTYAGTAQKVTTYIRRKYANEWAPYAENGVLNMKDSTFSAAAVPAGTPLENRLLLIEDKLVGTVFVVR